MLAGPHPRSLSLGAALRAVRSAAALGPQALFRDPCRRVIARRYDFGRFAPYFERPCFLPCTPTASSVPRTT